MRAAALAAIALAACLAGCGGGLGGAVKSAGGGTQSGEQVVRSWTSEVYAGDYAQAAGLFAPGAVVEQSERIVLANRSDAEAFNRTLPCRAKVTSIQRERSGTLLAYFKLFPGALGGCPKGGDARVRFRIVDGRIELWRQLPEEPAAPGSST